ncbi:MAG: hypothetical protein ACI9GW_003011 [Halieaceae bacterium]|jgi:hypothetical protein
MIGALEVNSSLDGNPPFLRVTICSQSRLIKKFDLGDNGGLPPKRPK